MRRPRPLLLTLALLALCGEGQAGAAPRVLRLSVQGHLTCPSEIEVRRALERRFGSGKIVTGKAAPGALSLRLRALHPGALEMTLDDGSGGPPVQRTLSARPDECESLADTVTLLVDGWLTELPWRGEGFLPARAPATAPVVPANPPIERGGHETHTQPGTSGAGSRPHHEAGATLVAAPPLVPSTRPSSAPATRPVPSPSSRVASQPTAAPAHPRVSASRPAVRLFSAPSPPRLRLEAAALLALAPEGTRTAGVGELAAAWQVSDLLGVGLDASVATRMSDTLSSGPTRGTLNADRVVVAALGRLALPLAAGRALRLDAGPALHITYAYSVGFPTDGHGTFFDPAFLGRVSIEQPLGPRFFVSIGGELLFLAHREAFVIQGIPSGALKIPAAWGAIGVGLGAKL